MGGEEKELAQAAQDLIRSRDIQRTRERAGLESTRGQRMEAVNIAKRYEKAKQAVEKKKK